LSDLETGEVFYVGRGNGNRVFSHVQQTIDNPQANDKLERIREIQAKGLEVKHEILRHNLTDKEAFEVEAAMTNFINVANLSNKVVGHGVENRVRMMIPGIIAFYGAEPIRRAPIWYCGGTLTFYRM
jgi:uncharacterized protein